MVPLRVHEGRIRSQQVTSPSMQPLTSFSSHAAALCPLPCFCPQEPPPRSYLQPSSYLRLCFGANPN